MKQYKSTGLIVILLIALLPVGVSQTADDDPITGLDMYLNAYQ